MKFVCHLSVGQPRSTGSFLCGQKSLKKEKYASTNKDAKTIKLACWNISTILEKTDSKRPAIRSALITQELSRFGIDIAALSEVCLPEK